MCCAWGGKKRFLNSEWAMEKKQWPPSDLGMPLLVSKRLHVGTGQGNLRLLCYHCLLLLRKFMNQ